MNKEEIDIWLKHFADKPTSYQMFDENGMIKEINFFIVFRYLKELQQKADQLEQNINTAINFIDQVLQYHIAPFQPNELDEDINTLIGILRSSSNE